ncbi:MAG: arsenate reductase ArsC [Calditrichaeota bacterium]|nr:MAG: arsenate reductase ArsC [Calditrichota bacterium]
MMKRILILCTGNSCRSQMAEGFLREYDPNLHVRSAGTNPSGQIHPKAVKVMSEIGINISGGKPENVDQYLNEEWDYLITVCDNARESCPVFLGKVTHRLHIGFEDPAEATGTETEVMHIFRKVRDEIKRDFNAFYEKNIKN